MDGENKGKQTLLEFSDLGDISTHPYFWKPTPKSGQFMK